MKLSAFVIAILAVVALVACGGNPISVMGPDVPSTTAATLPAVVDASTLTLAQCQSLMNAPPVVGNTKPDWWETCVRIVAAAVPQTCEHTSCGK